MKKNIVLSVISILLIASSQAVISKEYPAGTFLTNSDEAKPVCDKICKDHGGWANRFLREGPFGDPDSICICKE